MPLDTLKVSVVAGPDAGRTFVATSDSISVGSADGNDLVLSDATVSRYHVELRVKNDRISVLDHGSTNGTSFGPVLIERGSVAPGTTITLGRTQLSVVRGETAEVDVYPVEQLGRLRGRAPVMLRLMAKLERSAQSDASILLLGETGTGKEVIAHAIHDVSPRKSRPFETVDCGSLMPTLIASELFGHEKGAFTGADRQHVGAFERADGGTLFLDELGELPSSLQPALLGALERRSFRRVGGTKPISVDVRLISATHRDLREEVNAGRFRQDLYYRIGVVLLEIPSLRERPEDIPMLIEHFLKEASFEGDISAVVPEAAMEQLKRHRWPGNVRELRNFVDAALALGEAPRLGERESEAPSKPVTTEVSGAALLLDKPYSDAKSALLEGFEVQYLRHLLEVTNDNISAAARHAKMNRSYLLELLKKHGIR